MRLLLGTSLAMAAVLGLLGATLFLAMRRSLISDFDAVSLARANTLASVCYQNGSWVRFQRDYPLSDFTRADQPDYFEIRLDNGRILASSPASSKLNFSPSDGNTAFADLTLPDGRRWRVLTFRFTPRVVRSADANAEGTAVKKPATAVLILARQTASLDATLVHLRGLMLLLFTAAVGGSEVALLIVVANAIRPVSRLTTAIESFSESDLSRRIDAGDIPAELAPMLQRLNGLLGRLEEAFVRERAFTADVAHELRTPLAGLRSTLQVCRSRPRDCEAYEITLDKCFKITDGITSMVQTLLMLARADAGELTVARAPVNLAALLEECWQPFEARAAARQLHVTKEVPDACQIDSGAEQLRMIFSNLFDNAISYTTQAGHISISLQQANGLAAVEITNSCTNIVEADLKFVFDRFWRGDAARTGTGLHYGLGLSLCARLIALIDGKISARLDANNFVVSINLALAPTNDATLQPDGAIIDPSRLSEVRIV
jgi:two-component system heavy metal sensor histidine kinase CusS